MTVWTEERIAEIARLWNDGLTTAEIGRHLGVSKNAVIGKAHRLGLPARPSPIKRIATRRLPRPAPRPIITVRPTVINSTGPGCKWPFGHPDEADFYFCGKPSLGGKSYCAEHYAVAYLPAKTSSDANAA